MRKPASALDELLNRLARSADPRIAAWAGKLLRCDKAAGGSRPEKVESARRKRAKT